MSPDIPAQTAIADMVEQMINLTSELSATDTVSAIGRSSYAGDAA